MNTTFQGTLFDGETLAATPVTLGLVDGRIASDDQTTVPALATTDIQVSHRLGNTPRYLYLPGGRTVETADNEAVDALLVRQRRDRLVALIHALETHARVATAATLILVAAIAAIMWWGLPVLAYRVAMAMPDSLERQAGRTALATVNQMLARSQLSGTNRKRVTIQVERLVKAGGLSVKPEVVFLSMGGDSPNAFALPGGTIVMSDELVELATDGELAAVLAHEIGHWQYRHGMQSVLRSSSALLLVSAVTGDLSTLTTFASTIPFLLLQRGYSREFEAQADAYAVDLMRKAGVELRHFESILMKLGSSRPKEGNDLTYLSTHPGTIERINRIKAGSPAARTGAPAPAGGAGPSPDDNAAPSTGSNLVAPAAVSRSLPEYPVDLASARIPGHVLVEYVVDLDGRVRDARILRSSHQDLEPSALAAVRQWKFTPGSRHGRPAALKSIAWVEFSSASRPTLKVTDFGPGDILPQAVHRPPPIFPLEMRAARLSGKVTVEFVIDPDGRTRSPHLIRSTHKEFEAPALEAIAEWRFLPARKNGQIVEVLASQDLEFNADE